MTATLSPASTDRRFDLLGLGTFVIVGLPDGMLGTAWPAMRHTFGVPVGDLGLILLVNTIGSVVVAAFVGRLIQRLGVSVLLAVAGSCAALGGIGYVAAPGLWLILAIGPLLGAAAGMMDGGLNTAIALTGRRRLLNLLHGFYGIGTAVGPLVVTAAILAGSWRPAYLLLVALDFTAAALWALHDRRIPATGAVRAPTGDGAGQSTDLAATWSRRRVVSVLTLGLIVFFLYTGLEVSAGQWETSYLRGHLDMSAS
ncbi:MAG: major facilitator superfamily 1, partial [Actinomycetia bacterium]|nr:major facilitator superfamily 1 [Actinomycetes bacterium]